MSTTNLTLSPYAFTLGTLRSLVVPTYTGETTPAQLGVNPRGALFINQDFPERAELARLGGTVMMRSDEVACVTAIPTTTAAHTLWNGYPSGGKALIIDRLVWTCTTSAAAASAFALVAVVNKATNTSAPATKDTQAQTVYSTGKGYAGLAVPSHAVTVADDVWFPIGNSSTPSALTGTVGVTVEANVNGLIVLAPGYNMGVACVAANTTAKGKVTFYFHEVAIPVATS